jgi:DNA repair exonuclease SbcCD nuclease subunit
MVKRIIQVADIHIRNAVRHEEYAEQLGKFIDECKKAVKGCKKSEVRILICGDLVHQKNTISNELMTFTSSLIRNLEKIGTVIVYSGNHDLIVNNQSRTDTITALFETAKFTNSYFLDKELNYESGFMHDENITWCLYSIHDDYVAPDTITARSERPDNWFVGLYHGPVVGATLNNGTVMQEGVSGKTFDGCDVVMAGDIHKRQVIETAGIEVVYPGSLIQQTYGETVTVHGFAVWDAEKRTREFVDLPSSYGFYDFEINDPSDIDADKEYLKNY